MKEDKAYLIIFFSPQETLYAEKVLKRNKLKHELVPPAGESKNRVRISH